MKYIITIDVKSYLQIFILCQLWKSIKSPYTGEKPFTYDVYKKAFSQLLHLKTHSTIQKSVATKALSHKIINTFYGLYSINGHKITIQPGTSRDSSSYCSGLCIEYCYKFIILLDIFSV